MMVRQAKKESEGLIARDNKANKAFIYARSRKSLREAVGLLDDKGVKALYWDQCCLS